MKKLTLFLAMCLISIASFAATGGAVNENISWSLDDEGTLTISGTGDMPDYDTWQYSPSYSPSPWYQYRGSITHIKIEEGITSIGTDSFYGCETLTFVEIPNTIETINNDAFSYCINLRQVTIPNSVEIIGFGAFYNCSSLIEITIPNLITVIDDCVFYECRSLKKVVIPKSVVEIKRSSFGNCINLQTIIVEWETPLVYWELKIAIYGMQNCKLIVPAGTKSLYQQAEVWQDFIIIEQINTEINPEAIFSWQPTEDATGYQLIIYSDEAHTEIVRILNFDSEGNFISEQQQAKSHFATLAENTNFSYQITNLSPSTTYYYTLTAYQNETEIAQQQGSFTTTTDITGINVLPANVANVTGYYNILGTKLSKEPASGLYIILYDNEKTEKVMR